MSEVQNEAKAQKFNLFLVTLDTFKAVDVVWQNSLLGKIYHAGVGSALWTAVASLYTNSTQQ